VAGKSLFHSHAWRRLAAHDHHRRARTHSISRIDTRLAQASFARKALSRRSSAARINGASAAANRERAANKRLSLRDIALKHAALRDIRGDMPRAMKAATARRHGTSLLLCEWPAEAARAHDALAGRHQEGGGRVGCIPAYLDSKARIFARMALAAGCLAAASIDIFAPPPHTSEGVFAASSCAQHRAGVTHNIDCLMPRQTLCLYAAWRLRQSDRRNAQIAHRTHGLPRVAPRYAPQRALRTRTLSGA